MNKTIVNFTSRFLTLGFLSAIGSTPDHKLVFGFMYLAP